MLFTNSRFEKQVPRVWTIGHSTREIDVFVALLNENEIKLVADVRMFPGSRRYPQFGREALAKSLGEAGIGYEHFPELGGRRKADREPSRRAARLDQGKKRGTDAVHNAAKMTNSKAVAPTTLVPSN